MAISRHLDKLAIRGFRGLETINFDDFGAFNVFLGANDTGKTSVLESVFLVAGLSNLSLLVSIQNQRNYVVRTFDDLSYIFHKLKLDQTVELIATTTANAERRTLSISARDPDLLLQIDRRAEERAGAIRGATQKMSVEFSSPLSSPKGFRYNATLEDASLEEPLMFEGELGLFDNGINLASPMPQSLRETISQRMIVNTKFLRPGPHYDSESFANVIVRKKDSELLKVLQDMDSQIRDFTVLRDTVYVDTGLKEMIPLNMFGAGVARAAETIAACVQDESRILLIDEIEDGLHHTAVSTLLEAVLSMSRERGIQVFATTHSIGVLESLRDVLDKARFRELQAATVCFTLARDKSGAVRPYRYDYDQFDHCISNGIEIR